MKIKCCFICNCTLNKDIVSLNKKLLGRNNEKFMCMTCLADYIECSEEDLLAKIEQFKEQGCDLFK